MRLKRIGSILLITAAVLAVLIAAGVTFGGPSAIAPMASINNPFQSLDYSRLPPLRTYPARDGAALAYRHYAAAGTPQPGSVVLVHGSSGSSNGMHTMALALAAAGHETYALDMRGHGESKPRGHIGFVGELESDIEDFVKFVHPAAPSTLTGFSSGGGFVLRFAGSERQAQFQSYLLVSPFLSPQAPTQRPNAGWASVGIPRIVAIAVLNHLGIQAFNDLTVINFALADEAKRFLTPSYSYNLLTNFGPLRDYKANIAAVQRPCAVLVGASDELFYADKFEPTIRDAGQAWPVTLVPGLGHIPMILDPRAIAAASAAVSTLQAMPASGGTIP